MTEPTAKEIAEHWFKILKSSPHADSWNVEDSFIEKPAATWPWILVYFELLDMTPMQTKECASPIPEEFSRATTLGLYALGETLGLRFDCASALFLLLLMSRAFSRLSGDTPSEKKEQCVKQCTEAVNRLVESANKDEWSKWFEEMWREGPNGSR